MLQHDYLLEILGRFVQAVTAAFTGIFINRDYSQTYKVEEAVAELLDLDVTTAMALSPDSLVTMMSLSGVGESVAGYASYALNRLSRAYDKAGESELAHLRRAQAAAIANAFNANVHEIPKEFLDLEKHIEQAE